MTSQTMAGSQIQTLGRQGSLYNLTLNEVQSHLTEPLLSMNLDDLLKSIFPEDSPHQTNHTSTSTNLERQGSSSITMPPALSKKTIDEVWRGINVNPPPNGHLQSEFGEMTLESFLLKAGVVLDPADGNAVIPPNSRGYGTAVIPPNLRGKARGSSREVITPDFSGKEVIAPNMRGDVTVAVAANWIGPGTVIDANGYGSGSGSGEGMDKVMERRHKRMIKNRESAARSRARKQAYTNELENKVSRLEEENERLKKQKVIDKILCLVPVQTPKYQLRRTSSF